MKRILVVDTFDFGVSGDKQFSGGAELHTYVLCKTLLELGYNVTSLHVIKSGYTETTASFNLKGLNQVYLKSKPRFEIVKGENKKSLAMSWSKDLKVEFKRFLKVNQFDYAINNFKANLSNILLEHNIPTIQPLHSGTATLGGMVGTITNRVFAPLLKYGPEMFKLGWASEYVAEDYRIYASKHLGIDIDPWLHPYYVGKSDNVDEVLPSNGKVYIVSRTSPEKRIHVSLDILDKLNIPTKVYTIIGDEDYFDKRIKKYTENPNIEFVYNAMYPDIMEDLRSARLLVLDSNKETFGLSGLEAMERGVPIVYHNNNLDVAPHESIVDTELLTYITKSKDLDDHTDKLRYLDLSLETRVLIANKTRSKFSTSAWKSNFESIFNSFQQTKLNQLF